MMMTMIPISNDYRVINEQTNRKYQWNITSHLSRHISKNQVKVKVNWEFRRTVPRFLEFGLKSICSQSVILEANLRGGPNKLL